MYLLRVLRSLTREQRGTSLTRNGPSHLPISVHSLDGHRIMTISAITGPVSAIMSGNHREELEFFIFKSLLAPIVFGHPWLSLHGPHINWADNSVSLLLCSLSCVSCLFFFSVAGGGDRPIPSSCRVPQSATGLQQVLSCLSSAPLRL